MYPSPGVVERIGPDWDWIWIDSQHGRIDRVSLPAPIPIIVPPLPAVGDWSREPTWLALASSRNKATK